MRSPGSAVKAVIRHRRPDPECWEVVVRAACNPLGGSWDAAKTVAQAGSAVSGHADRLAKALATRLGNVEELALALAGMGDLRALSALERIAKDGRLPYARPWAPHLAALPAAELLPAILPGLRSEPPPYQAGFMLELLALWGTAAAPAVPEVVRYLETPYAYDALRVLGRIGPPAAVAADGLAAYATGHAPRTSRLHQRRAAWAHWRVTGDPTLALDVCGAAVGSGTAGHGLPFLADLGPLAAEHADTVRGLMESPGAWTRVAAAHAYWRITGDPGPAVPVLLAEVDPDWTGQPAFPTREAIRRLGAIGAPAAASAPLLRRILAAEKRLSHPYDGVRILVDEAYVRTLTEALARIGAGADAPAAAPEPAPESVPEPAPQPSPGPRRGVLGRWLGPRGARTS
ncbi:hypothetical protein ADK52_30210 [Streptomyces sp. WM6372]|uniref:hypothetical protein n=1 Tax=Streptomyces sp. WM6372 TaxID=1415555 RepID=UPI0006AED0E8|nr:hypothetical protein [Streptomyces sp. WM6372]KOU18875.1 hypothetical protein ADK52_30210 [Streptomyces sp. WM6372]